ncbi:MAG: GNAT family N-acetyltransferase [Bacteroidaceae bacterium]|nr:GNAT family N-acetyltransferase [Bacteroidaceae bacterium]
MYIRKATYNDIPALMKLFECAKSIMRASGNLHQWGSGYPSLEVVRHDIDNGTCYVSSTYENGEIEATMAFIPGPDPTYSVIEDGEWLNDNPYFVIHRIAVAKPGKGYARRLLEWAFERTANVRVDTHRDNVIMRHILQKFGFRRCGVIYLANGSARDAFQLCR